MRKLLFYMLRVYAMLITAIGLGLVDNKVRRDWLECASECPNAITGFVARFVSLLLLATVIYLVHVLLIIPRRRL
jgi:hypothetical protein